MTKYPEDLDRIVVLSSRAELAEALAALLQQEGWHVVPAQLQEVAVERSGAQEFLQAHQARLVICHMPVPVEDHWPLFEHLYHAPAASDIPFIVFSPDTAALSDCVPRDWAVKVLGRPYDTATLSQAVPEAMRA